MGLRCLKHMLIQDPQGRTQKLRIINTAISKGSVWKYLDTGVAQVISNLDGFTFAATKTGYEFGVTGVTTPTTR